MKSIGKMRWRCLDLCEVWRPSLVTAVIKIGDLLWAVPGEEPVIPASEFEIYNGALIEARRQFRRKFVGVAMTVGHAGEKTPIQIATGGGFAFPLAAFQDRPLAKGDLFAPSAQHSRDRRYFSAIQLTRVTCEYEAIFRLFRVDDGDDHVFQIIEREG